MLFRIAHINMATLAPRCRVLLLLCAAKVARARGEGHGAEYSTGFNKYRVPTGYPTGTLNHPGSRYHRS
jgi:hypothetical protein